jgi:hypothetical protein
MQARSLAPPSAAGPSILRALVFELLESGALRAASAEAVFEARPAASCLLAPQPGDEVLLAADGERAFVLAVLTRPDPQAPAPIALPERSVVACRELSVATSGLELRSDRALIESRRMSLQGDHLAWRFRLARLAASLASFAFGSLLGQSRDMRLAVERGASIETGRLSLKSKGGLSARAEGIDLRAAGPVVIDGRHLRLG